MKRIIRVGSRESRLAVVQSELIIHAIEQKYPDIHCELITMKTTGDRILDRALDEIGGKGLFVKELDQALRDGRIDLSVHSLKDMPMEEEADLPLLAYSRREDPRDALLLPFGQCAPDAALPVGCSSRRRKLQLKGLYPMQPTANVRGNVLTRLSKLDAGEFSGLVLACAGLRRLGLEGRISRIFTPQEMIPAAGQGILAVQGRAGEDCAYLDAVDDRDARDAAIAERAFVTALGGGCSSPVAAYAVLSGNELMLTGLHYEEQTGSYCTGSLTGERTQAQALGVALAKRLGGL